MKTNLNARVVQVKDRSTKLPGGLWNRLLWFVAGNELIFIPPGLEFETLPIETFAWVLEFNEVFVKGFVDRYPDFFNNVLFSKEANCVNIPLTTALRSEMNDLAILMNHAQEKNQSELFLQAYADLILLNANNAFAKQDNCLI